jgi:acyl-CoA dehydrogenase
MNKYSISDLDTDWRERAAMVAAVVANHAAECDLTDSFVEHGYAALREAGFFTALVPAEFGGGDASVSDIAQAIRTIAASCGSTALAFAMHSHLVAVAAWRWRHQNAPTDGLLRRVVGENLILVSSGGSDWLPSGGVAVPCDGGFRVNARKPFSSGSPRGDLLSTSAVFEDPEAGPTVLHFSVPLSAEGVVPLDNWKVLGMRGTGSQDLELRDVFVPEAAVAGRRPAGKWHPLFHTICMIAFPLIYSAYLGIADRARDEAVALFQRRGPSDVAALQLGELENAHLSAAVLWAEMLGVAETGAPGPAVTSKVMALRTLVGRGVLSVVERAMEAIGGGGFYRGTVIERTFRDIQGARFHPMPEKQQLMLSGRVAAGWAID